LNEYPTLTQELRARNLQILHKPTYDNQHMARIGGHNAARGVVPRGQHGPARDDGGRFARPTRVNVLDDLSEWASGKYAKQGPSRPMRLLIALATLAAYTAFGVFTFWPLRPWRRR
jgi:hypothetical protein